MPPPPPPAPDAPPTAPTIDVAAKNEAGTASQKKRGTAGLRIDLNVPGANATGLNIPR